MSVKKNLYFINFCVESQNKIHSNFSIDFDAYSHENIETEFQVPTFWKASDMNAEEWPSVLGPEPLSQLAFTFTSLNTELA